MSTPIPSSQEGSDPQASESRTAPLGIPTQLRLARMFRKRSTRLGYLFFLQNQGRLSPGQHLFLMREQDQVRLEELHSAILLFEKLVASQRATARAKKDIEYTLNRTPHLDSKSVQREQRRIGVGYRDKGSLRPKHEDRLVLPRMWWSEDIAPALWTIPETPRWLTTDEVFTGKGGSHILQEIALLQIVNNPILVHPCLMKTN
jgi:hypothetical protein